MNAKVERPVANRRALNAACIAAAVGAGLWFATSLVTGLREPWDARAYWVAAYPLSVVACALLGYSYPRHPWRWPLVLFAAQFVAMCVRNGELGNLWPLGLALFAVLALPGIVAAMVAARFSS